MHSDPRPEDSFVELRLSLYLTIAVELAYGNSAVAKAQWKRLCSPYAILE